MGRSHISCAPLRCAVKAFLVFSLSQRSEAQSMRERHFIWFSLILAFAPKTKTRTVYRFAAVLFVRCKKAQIIFLNVKNVNT